MLDSIKYEIARQDQVFHFVKDHANKYGSPLWNDGNIYNFGSDKIKVYFIPFAKNNKIEAILAAYIDVVSTTLYYFELLDRNNTDELIKRIKIHPLYLIPGSLSENIYCKRRSII